ncbi:general secretion pathway protein GspB [Vibrio mexicanus]|uniref:general secretion pathway protein GspB n=1 Tax=Vibrio mexicanus TaxID=1004326 RepID=UPI00063C6173|nr:general secretion pathway protein GspB [Vibrio mexicanus]
MSKILAALEQSEQNHQAQTMPYSGAERVNEVKENWAPKGLLFIALPAVIAATVGIAQEYIKQKSSFVPLPSSEEVVVDAYFAELAYPTFVERELSSVPQVAAVASQPNQTSLIATNIVESPPNPTTLESPQVLPETVSPEIDLSEIDLSEFSPLLAQRVESALAQTQFQETSSNKPSSSGSDSQQDFAVDLISQSNRYIGKLPALNFQTHVYSSNVGKRWVRVNGVEYVEGDWVSDDVQLIGIEPQSTKVRFEREVIEIPALYDWQG